MHDFDSQTSNPRFGLRAKLPLQVSRPALWFCCPVVIALLLLTACAPKAEYFIQKPSPKVQPSPTTLIDATVHNTSQVIHVFVALCDNINQGIVPVPPSLGNGDDPVRNLYWGAGFGVKTFFSKEKNWSLVAKIPNPRSAVLERVIFKHTSGAYMVADAYQGAQIKQTTFDFLNASAGAGGETIRFTESGKDHAINAGGESNLLVYVGHDGLMDFSLSAFPKQKDNRAREAVILACASKYYFTKPLKETGATPLLWTTNLMAPEAYVLGAALNAWLTKQPPEEVRKQAAAAYNKYQHCGVKAALNLFATGW
jgi:hypothetical protein